MIIENKNHGLSYTAHLPLEWLSIESKPDIGELVLMSQTNESLFKTLISMDEYHPELSDNSDPMQLQLQRMDDKLNTLVHLLGRVIALSSSLPTRKKTVLTPHSLIWIDNHAPAISSHVIIKLYIKPGFPQPLELVGRIDAVDKDRDNIAITAILCDQNEFVIEGLEKFIFRHHRRVVALSKRVGL